jgi:hypothetical protein
VSWIEREQLTPKLCTTDWQHHDAIGILLRAPLLVGWLCLADQTKPSNHSL